jgi:hypothetical protein
MDLKQYIGWTNYETWETALWLDDEERSRGQGRTLARFAQSEADRLKALTDKSWGLEEDPVRILAGMVRDFIEDHDPVPSETLYSILMHSALKVVDWTQIAEHFLEDVTKEKQHEGMHHDEQPQMENTTSRE